MDRERYTHLGATFTTPTHSEQGWVLRISCPGLWISHCLAAVDVIFLHHWQGSGTTRVMRVGATRREAVKESEAELPQFF